MTEPAENGEPARKRPLGRWALAVGPLPLLAALLLPPPPGMPEAAWLAAGLAFWMGLWWSTEAVPIPATALLPLVVLPLTGLAATAKAAAPYAHPLIFLFLGGFLLAAGIQKHNLHRRIALMIVRRTGTRPSALVAGFMIAAGALSMWVSNTATAMMMLPIALSVVAEIRSEGGGERLKPMTCALLLAVAYGASIGGIATLIGTPPNALLAAYAEREFGIAIGFAKWMAVGLPVAVVLGTLAWLVLTRWAFPVAGLKLAITPDSIARHLAELGRPGPAERRVLIVFLCTAGLWLFRPLLSGLPGLGGLDDTVIAIAGGFTLFLLPSGEGGWRPLLTWEDATSLPFGTLLLFGGGLSLAETIQSSGLAAWIGDALGSFAGLPPVLLVGIVALAIVLLTELTSNTATTAAFLPLMGALAAIAGLPPLLLMIPTALAASAAFMLPVATPPNAIVHGSGLLPIGAMVRAGIWLNLAATATITLLIPPLVRWLF